MAARTKKETAPVEDAEPEARVTAEVKGTIKGAGGDLVIELTAEGVRVSVGKESTVLDRQLAVVARRKLEQATAWL